MNHRNREWVLFLGRLVCSSLLLACGTAAQTGALAANPAPAGSFSGNDTRKQPEESVTIPAGTHLLMKLVSPLHTASSTAGSGAYLETVFPVVANGHVVIPEHTRVMGEVIAERRPGRVRGRAQLRLQFTQLILPDHRDFVIAGNLQSLPGSRTNRTVDRDGTIEPVDQIDADVYTLAGTTMSGALLGSIGRPGLGTGVGAAIGGGLGLAKVLFTRGDEISLPVGTRVEMVLRRPMTLQPTPQGNAETSGAVNTRPQPPRVETSGERASDSSSYSSASSPDEEPLRESPHGLPCLRDGRTLQCLTPKTLALGR